MKLLNSLNPKNVWVWQDSVVLEDRLLLFSQSLCTLNLLEDFLKKKFVPGTQVHAVFLFHNTVVTS